MQFIHTNNASAVAQAIARKLLHHIENNEHVLWLVPGGSNIDVAVQVGTLLARKDLQTLHVTLTDERFGPVNHANSNWQQLRAKGFMQHQNANLYPVLTGKSAAQTTHDFDLLLQQLFTKCTYVLGFFGIGTDGHTSGILPGSQALTSTKLAYNYVSDPYIRITTTPTALQYVSDAVVYTTGQQKWPILEQLSSTIPVGQQPAQLLKQIPTLTIYNDYKGEQL